MRSGHVSACFTHHMLDFGGLVEQLDLADVGPERGPPHSVELQRSASEGHAL